MRPKSCSMPAASWRAAPRGRDARTRYGLAPDPVGRRMGSTRPGNREAAMERAYDLVIRGGRVYDGEGGEPYDADVAIRDGRIAKVGEVAGAGAEEIDARGL